MVHVVMPDPVHAQADKTDGVGQKLRPQLEQRRCDLHVGRIGREVGYVEFQDQEGHRDGKDAITQRLDAVFPQFK